MTDRDHDPAHDPAQDAVRRLLADARHDEPMPDNVRARLDSRLAELTAERREVRSTDAVVDLAARRRQRRRTGLLAAAAVVVAGVGLGQVLQGTGGLGSGGDSLGAADGESAERSVPAEDHADAGQAEAPTDSSAESRSYAAQSDTDGPVVSSSRLRADLQRVRAGSVATSKRSTPELYDSLGCGARVVGPGQQVVITLDGDPALAVFRPVSRARQEVDLYECAAGDQIRTIRLPAP